MGVLGRFGSQGGSFKRDAVAWPLALLLPVVFSGLLTLRNLNDFVGYISSGQRSAASGCRWQIQRIARWTLVGHDPVIMTLINDDERFAMKLSSIVTKFERAANCEVFAPTVEHTDFLSGGHSVQDYFAMTRTGQHRRATGISSEPFRGFVVPTLNVNQTSRIFVVFPPRVDLEMVRWRSARVIKENSRPVFSLGIRLRGKLRHLARWCSDSDARLMILGEHFQSVLVRVRAILSCHYRCCRLSLHGRQRLFGDFFLALHDGRLGRHDCGLRDFGSIDRVVDATGLEQDAQRGDRNNQSADCDESLPIPILLAFGCLSVAIGFYFINKGGEMTGQRAYWIGFGGYGFSLLLFIGLCFFWIVVVRHCPPPF
jgi:hypothetical protein